MTNWIATNAERGNYNCNIGTNDSVIVVIGSTDCIVTIYNHLIPDDTLRLQINGALNVKVAYAYLLLFDSHEKRRPS